ncbi:hypothetical protein A2V49_02685 [candidate division WWE3 bacterium RBG_19FT_COMBO_34_6]|uniref:Calcineurin-like phosphoesterase domain-containing protein n=1 Tax=candidate division WWE3 bacterium RBG_19FT_COMBO_34_6 TaxID=1802612 RepID=A0A1F4UL04_UNCKA|nr:MAG: hypothetical protein A2V49_02685 [candidate division WWE3 bacterium RBG_19FT_COMBO_34_6]
MGLFKKRRRNSSPKLSQRILRSVVSIVVLTAFVLGLSLLVKQISVMDPDKIVAIASPLLAKVGISNKMAGDVAGIFVERIFKTNIEPSKNYDPDNLNSIVEEPGIQTNTTSEDKKDAIDMSNISFKAALIADSHSTIPNLIKALEIANINNVHTLFFLGDYTDLGEEDKLIQSKKVMDSAGILYYSLPGDRDLYQTVGNTNFNKVFGQAPTSVVIGENKFVLLDNSANYTLITDDVIERFKKELIGADFVLLSQPVYYPNISYLKPIMGYVKGEVTSDVKEQGEEILSMIRNSDVKAVIAGDHHSFSRSLDPKRSTLEHVAIGSVTDEKTDLGRPSITVLSTDNKGNYMVEEINF